MIPNNLPQDSWKYVDNWAMSLTSRPWHIKENDIVKSIEGKNGCGGPLVEWQIKAIFFYSENPWPRWKLFFQLERLRMLEIDDYNCQGLFLSRLVALSYLCCSKCTAFVGCVGSGNRYQATWSSSLHILWSTFQDFLMQIMIIRSHQPWSWGPPGEEWDYSSTLIDSNQSMFLKKSITAHFDRSTSFVTF